MRHKTAGARLAACAHGFVVLEPIAALVSIAAGVGLRWLWTQRRNACVLAPLAAIVWAVFLWMAVPQSSYWGRDPRPAELNWEVRLQVLGTGGLLVFVLWSYGVTDRPGRALLILACAITALLWWSIL